MALTGDGEMVLDTIEVPRPTIEVVGRALEISMRFTSATSSWALRGKITTNFVLGVAGAISFLWLFWTSCPRFANYNLMAVLQILNYFNILTLERRVLCHASYHIAIVIDDVCHATFPDDKPVGRSWIVHPN